ncbi:MAG: alpha/beta hydrolase fold domain-containing protein [Planctomycetaceae bacterium]
MAASRFVPSLIPCFLVVASFGSLMADDKPAAPKTKRAQNPKVRPLPPDVRVERDIEYAKIGEQSLKLDIYRSGEHSGRAPLIVWIHGGGWSKGSKDNSPAAWLATHGYVVASVQYRLTDVAKWPAQIDDCRAAIRWLRSNADRFGIDPELVGAWGSSAGGQLVSMLGVADPPADEPVSSRVKAVCDYFGPSDLITQPKNVPGPGKTDADLAASNTAKLLGGIVRDIPDKANAASPLHHVSAGDAPFLIVHGSKDDVVPLDQSERFQAKLEMSGVSSELYVIDGAGHGGPAFQKPEVRARVRQFFDKHLKNAAE